MPSFQAVCDCCMGTVYPATPELDVRDCPFCGVGKLLGPWPTRPRFEPNGAFEIAYRLMPEEGLAERD
jgi:hypothetical protein